MDYTLADLVRITGAKRRSVQLWAEGGAIQAYSETERGGSGTHRRFDDWEAIIACVIHEFAKQSVAIGQLIEIAAGVRAFLASPQAYSGFKDAISGTGKHYLLVNTADFERNIKLISQKHSETATFFAIMHDFEEKNANSATAAIFLNTCLQGLR